jgi:hypothetical protein
MIKNIFVILNKHGKSILNNKKSNLLNKKKKQFAVIFRPLAG